MKKSNPTFSMAPAPKYAALNIAPHVEKPTRPAIAYQRATEEINNIGNAASTTSSASSETDDEEEEEDDGWSKRKKTTTTTSRGKKKPSHSKVVTREQHIRETTTINLSDTDSSDEQATKKKKNKRKTGRQQRSKKRRAATDDSSSSSGSRSSGDDDNTPSEKNKKMRMTTTDDIYLSNAEFYTKGANCSMHCLRTALGEIMCQGDAVEQVIYKLHAQALTAFRSPKASDRICSLHLTGGSGVGKTQTTKSLASFFQVGEGTRYPNQYKPISLSKYSDQSHAVALTGAAAGLLGHDNQDLVVTLINAAKRVNPAEDNPFIILGLDEACKAHPAFMNSLNPLLSDGSIANVREQTFTIPRGTLLILLWTSNFAEHVMNPYENPDQTTRYIYEKMRRKGFDNCDIARMGGDPIVYAPLHHDAMYDILLRSGNERLCGHIFSRRFGTPVYRDVDGGSSNSSNILILNILKTYKIELGVRYPLEKYKTEIESLLTTAMDVIDREEASSSSLFGGGVTKLMILDDDEVEMEEEEAVGANPIYWCVSLPVTDQDRAQREQFLQAHGDLKTAVTQNRRNQRVFDTIFKAGNRRYKAIEYVVLQFKNQRGQTRYAYSLLQPVMEEEEEEEEKDAAVVVVKTGVVNDIPLDTDDDSSSSDDNENEEVMKVEEKQVKSPKVVPIVMPSPLFDTTEHNTRLDDLDTKTDKHANHISMLHTNIMNLNQQMVALMNTTRTQLRAIEGQSSQQQQQQHQQQQQQKHQQNVSEIHLTKMESHLFQSTTMTVADK